MLYIWISKQNKMVKSQFKKEYSDFRKSLTGSFYKSRELFSSIWMSNPFYASIKSNTEYPVSLKIWSYKNNK